MAKWFGKIGFAIPVEVRPGYNKDSIVERDYYGEVLRNSRRIQAADKISDDVTVSNEISIIADPFANENFHAIRYVQFMGTNWKVSNIDVQYPRLNLTLGGVYNDDDGPQA